MQWLFIIHSMNFVFWIFTFFLSQLYYTILAVKDHILFPLCALWEPSWSSIKSSWRPASLAIRELASDPTVDHPWADSQQMHQFAHFHFLERQECLMRILSMGAGQGREGKCIFNQYCLWILSPFHWWPTWWSKANERHFQIWLLISIVSFFGHVLCYVSSSFLLLLALSAFPFSSFPFAILN